MTPQPTLLWASALLLALASAPSALGQETVTLFVTSEQTDTVGQHKAPPLR